MVGYEYYVGNYMGATITPDAWPVLERDANAVLRRYERQYRVVYRDDCGRCHTVCAIAEAMWSRQQAILASEQPTSVSVGDVSESYGNRGKTDAAAATWEAEYYRRACLYADIYRGCGA